MTSSTVERTCWCTLREQRNSVSEEGICFRCGGRVSLSLEELKTPYRDPSRVT